MIQVLKETTSNYHYFVSQLIEGVSKRMGERYSIQVYKVMKNNSLELDSLVMQKEGENFAPNIYLEPYYEAHLQGVSISELADRISNIYRSSDYAVVDDKFDFTFENMRPHIIYRLVSYERNEKLLTGIPHVRYLDLAVTYHCLVLSDEDGIGTIRITNEHMKKWKVELSQLQEAAACNTQRIFPGTIRKMEDVIKGIISGEFDEWQGEIKRRRTAKAEGRMEESRETEDRTGKLKEGRQDTDHEEGYKMYILSNTSGINGASCLLYPDLLRDFSEYIQSDFYVFPSSIHEVILLPAADKKSGQRYAEMVRSINATQVAEEEVLSDGVYFYSRTEGLTLL
ncbi:hypothetical protein HNQ56_004488 [Anaerotaenia torta]|uniref:DUF5688 family protein n=1 Tax=Anaerotaenia torta TaxID=433293 RepID=UPI003D19611D